jgi:hypothetical protein
MTDLEAAIEAEAKDETVIGMYASKTYNRVYTDGYNDALDWALGLIRKDASQRKKMAEKLKAAADWTDYHNPVGAASCYDKHKVEAVIAELEGGKPT